LRVIVVAEAVQVGLHGLGVPRHARGSRFLDAYYSWSWRLGYGSSGARW
jgi:hypothetical protein